MRPNLGMRFKSNRNGLYYMLVLILCLFFVVSAEIEPWNLPVVPSSTYKAATAKADKQHPQYHKYIPKHAWIAVRNTTDARASHMLGEHGFIARNHDWTVNFCGNYEKDLFMETHFANSSFLWAYNILNPVIGTAKAELWRLGILYVEGGLYMDDDADIRRPLNDVIQPSDKFIVGKESYDWKDNCFTPDFPLSNTSLNARYGRLNQQHLFDNRFFFNWALFSMPGNPLLYRIMQHVTALIRREYLGDSAITMTASDHRGKLLMCASTFPITLAARELVIEEQQTYASSHPNQPILSPEKAMAHLGLKIGSEQFREFDADMKAWNNDHNPHRWVKQMNKHRLPYLRSYAPLSKEALEGKVVQVQGKRDIYLVDHGQRRPFTSLDTFLARGFSLDKVRAISPELADTMPVGSPV